MSTSFRLVLADDHALLRAGLRRLLERRGHRVVGEAGDGAETLACVERTRPDMLLLDLGMPGPHPEQQITTLRAAYPELRIVVLTGFCPPEQRRRVLDAGAHAVVHKTSGISRVLEALLAVQVAGQSFVDPALDDTERDGPIELTPREREILVLLARGGSYREVGRLLGVGERTVEAHRRHIADKLNLHTRAELVQYALQHGLLEMGPSDPG